MKVVSSPLAVNGVNGNIIMHPYARYAMPEEMAHNVVNAIKGSNSPYTISNIDSFERRYSGQNLNGKRVCIVRYLGIGDMLIVAGLAHYLRTLYPDVMIHGYTGTGYSRDAWSGSPDWDSDSAMPLPIPLDALKQYDYHIFYDGMIECNKEYDQENAYDDMFAFVGLHDVPSEFKRPYIGTMQSDMDFVESADLDLSKKYLVYQVSSSTPVRSYHPNLGAEFVRKFAKAHPDWTVYVTGEIPSPEMASAIADNVVDLCGKIKNWRHIIPLIAGASCVVTPDTGMGHIAAAFSDVPTVSLWGSFSHASRAKYYANHHPIEPKGVCPHAPCWTHGNEIPRNLCKNCAGYSDQSTHCGVINSIDPDDLVAKVEEVAM